MNVKKKYIVGFCIVILLSFAGVLYARSYADNKAEHATKKVTKKLAETVSSPAPHESITILPTKHQATQSDIVWSATATPILKNTIPPTLAPTALIPTALPTVPPPTPTPQPPADTQPPHSTIIYPQQNGEITYKTDGKVCATMGAPSDNVSNHNDIQTAFRFDGDGWSGFEKGRSYLCKDALSNGAHTLSVQSKDAAGNTENEQIISFTVNISGN